MNWNGLARWSTVALLTLGLAAGNVLAQGSAAGSTPTTPAAAGGKHHKGKGHRVAATPGDPGAQLKARIERVKTKLAHAKEKLEKLPAAQKADAERLWGEVNARVEEAQKALDAKDVKAARKALRAGHEAMRKLAQIGRTARAGKTRKHKRGAAASEEGDSGPEGVAEGPP